MVGAQKDPVKYTVNSVREEDGLTRCPREDESRLTSCSGKAAVYAPSFSSRATPTSARFFLPYTVLDRIS